VSTIDWHSACRRALTAAIAAAAAAFVLFIGVFFGIGTAGGADA
jgi:hypothetical protein